MSLNCNSPIRVRELMSSGCHHQFLAVRYPDTAVGEAVGEEDKPRDKCH